MLIFIRNYLLWVSRRFNIIAYLTAEKKYRLLTAVLGKPYVERLNGSIRRECTDHIIAWNKRHLTRTLRKYFDYYNNDRIHLGLDKETPMGRSISRRISPSDRLVRLPRVGGLHHRYEWREAA